MLTGRRDFESRHKCLTLRVAVTQLHKSSNYVYDSSTIGGGE